MDRYVDGWLDNWLSEWVDGWTEGWIEKHLRQEFYTHSSLFLEHFLLPVYIAILNISQVSFQIRKRLFLSMRLSLTIIYKISISAKTPYPPALNYSFITIIYSFIYIKL